MSLQGKQQDEPNYQSEVELSEPAMSLDDLLLGDSATADSPRLNYGGVFVGVLNAFDAEHATVEIPHLGALPARCTVVISEADLGKEVAVMFERADPSKPLLIGVMQRPFVAAEQIQADVDSERLVLTADREIVLRCGKASITLTRAGKILLRGAYLSSRSSGVNRIKGGSVQIN